ncbi:hypothetical protein H8N03_05260 [Ramlibacter sp. USB13]|uniref:DUF6351 domain-containing protein n=1 Tax=Ramlibacter cellulosilyticus TaxID=2764187 RepID=A0A923MP98_9BURK|nr:DUF6351 family protein [Ramlibacter cellulosilyticus]MBC5782343.1 hypothetical protein [Ramlibacter cellulosilyticus]
MRIRSLATAWPLALSALLAACGGGSSPPAASGAPSTLEARGRGHQPQVSLEGLKFWVGEQGPSGPTAYSGPQQQPFICRTLESNLGQPEVDNQDGIGQPVFEIPGNINSRVVGYSSQCSVKTQLAYFYWNGSDFKRFDPATQFTSPPADLKMTSVGGVARPFVIRVEAGTINRFAYAVAMLAPQPETTATPQDLDNTAWNRKLVYYMRGGVGIGHQQGTAMFTGGLWSEEKVIVPALLAQGYAVAASSGNETGVHYNLQLGGETAVKVKEHFVQTYGAPKYTVSLGGSGGAVQQYVYSQNHPGLFDAGIPIQSYPDMITQAIYVADCNLLEQYFLDDVRANPASPWTTWSRRSLIEGLATSDTEINPLTRTPGSSECIKGWGSAAPLVLNPMFTDPRFFQVAAGYGWNLAAFASVKWTHWNDLANIYGTDAQGYAPIPWDNVGVQYGLAALRSGAIAADEFLRINACAGSWKEQPDFVQWDTRNDPFDARNMRRSATCRTDMHAPAPRRSGDIGAMRAAYSSGHVFTGKTLDIPMIDLRPYLEAKLDMHNSRQSFSVRARLQANGGHAWKRQVVWFADTPQDLPARVNEAFAVLDKYLSDAPKTDAQRAAIGFVDQCFGAGGARIAAGDDVWAGVLDDGAKGACAQAYPILSSPRMVAGDSFRGDMFKCALKPLPAALHDGTYGTTAFTEAQKAWLAKIFPEGVCDYRRPDEGRAPGV